MDFSATTATAERGALHDLLIQLGFSGRSTACSNASALANQHTGPSSRLKESPDGVLMLPLDKNDLKEAATFATLEAILCSQVDALNARDFSKSSPLWKYKSSSWEALSGHFADQKLTLDQYVEEAWPKLAREHPDYHLRYTDMAMNINQNGDHVESFTNIEITGMPGGLIRSMVGIASFELREGDWLIVQQRTLPGVVGAESHAA